MTVLSFLSELSPIERVVRTHDNHMWHWPFWEKKGQHL